MNINEIKSPRGVTVEHLKDADPFCSGVYRSVNWRSTTQDMKSLCITLAGEYEKLQQETAAKITNKEALLVKAGICPKCHTEYQHAGDEPLAACYCTDNVLSIGWTSEPPLIWSLRKRIAELEAENKKLTEESIADTTSCDDQLTTLNHLIDLRVLENAELKNKIAELESKLKQQPVTPWPADPHKPVEGVEVFDMNDFHAKTNYGIKLYRVDGIEYFALNNHGHVISCTGNCISAWNVPVTKHNPNHTREIIERERDRIREERKAKEQPAIQPIPEGVKLWDYDGKEITHRWPELTQEQRQAIIDHAGKVRAVKASAPQPIKLKPGMLWREAGHPWNYVLKKRVDGFESAWWEIWGGSVREFRPEASIEAGEVKIETWHSVATGKKVEE